MLNNVIAQPSDLISRDEVMELAGVSNVIVSRWWSSGKLAKYQAEGSRKAYASRAEVLDLITPKRVN